MPALELQVSNDAAVGDPAVDPRDDLHPARPVVRGQRPLDPGEVRVGHAHKPTAGQRRLAAGAVPKANQAARYRPAQVHAVAVVQQLDVGQADRVLALDPQLEHQPVGKVDEVLVAHRHATQDRRLAVVDPMGIGPWVVHPIGVLPLRRASRAESAVAGRGQDLTQTLLIGVIALVIEQKAVYRENLESRIDCTAASQRPSWMSTGEAARFRKSRVHRSALSPVRSTALSCHVPGTPLSSWAPRGSNWIPEPATTSATV